MENPKIRTTYYAVPIRFSEMEKQARKNNASVGLLLSAAGLMALKEYNHSQKVQINRIYSGRDEPWISKLVGLTMTSLPIAVDFDNISGTRQLMGKMKRQNNENIPYATLSADLEDNSPALTDTLNIIYEGELHYPEDFFANTSNVNLFNKRTGISALISCGLLVARDTDSMTVFTNHSASCYDNSSMDKFVGMVIKEMLESMKDS